MVVNYARIASRWRITLFRNGMDDGEDKSSMVVVAVVRLRVSDGVIFLQEVAA